MTTEEDEINHQHVVGFADVMNHAAGNHGRAGNNGTPLEATAGCAMLLGSMIATLSAVESEREVMLEKFHRIVRLYAMSQPETVQ